MQGNLQSRGICQLPYLENEIREILGGFQSKACDCEKEFFRAFSEVDCKGHALAMNWFQQKGFTEFCNALPEISEAIKKYWFDEFNESLPESLLSPYELLQTYVSCKAKSMLFQL